MPTFADLGIPFPLFEAPTTQASDYAGLATCRLCQGKDRHCFELGIGDDLILPCPNCGAENPLSADDRADATCRCCHAIVPFPESLKAKKQLLVCYECLRAGKAAMTKGTEFGTVTSAQAIAGVTRGVPGLRTNQFELVPIDAEEDWYGVRVPHEDLWELLRTPVFHSWQDERWLFCCRKFMTFLGGWRDILSFVQPSNPRAFCESLLDPDDDANGRIWEAAESGNISMYVYRCKSCKRHRATWDMD